MFVLVACGNKPTEATQGISYADTVGLSQFQDWKAQHEREALAAYTPQASREPARKTSAPVVRRSSGSQGTGTTVSQPAPAPEKKGWSKAAKGTAIGAGSGAVLGAVIHKKNRVLGGVVGGVIGGGIGYGIGRSMDKKEGR